jgi:biotin carboxyl carrier protein
LFSLLACKQNENSSHKKNLQENSKKTSSTNTLINTEKEEDTSKSIQEKKFNQLISPNSGTVEWLIQEGKSFKKNECILRYDNTKQFLKISQLKASLQSKLSSTILNFPPELENRKTIWAEFASNLSADKLTPKLPLEFKEEFDFFNKNTSILKEYDDLLKEEMLIKDYFVLSKKPGKIQKWKVQKGTNVNKNSTLAEIEYN